MNETEQHPRAWEMGLRPGEFQTSPHPYGWVRIIHRKDEDPRNMICTHTVGDESRSIHYEIPGRVQEAEIMAQALTQANRTGRTPDELVDLIRELHECLVGALTAEPVIRTPEIDQILDRIKDIP